jgi:serine/threonine protein kinase
VSSGNEAFAPPSDDNPRLRQAVQEYLHQLEAGQRPDRQEFAARFPDLAEEMAPYLEALDMVHITVPHLSSSTAANPAPPGGETVPPEPIGDFLLVREIGRGGMGVVYEAVQRSLGRRVALKVLPFAASLDARQLVRFKHEAQAAANLHHPHIVPVYGVGSERGVHFYAMQIIEGQNLAALLEELRLAEAADSATRSALAIQFSSQRSNRMADYFRTVVRLIAQAADALDHAHGLGIVHRDVKPANLLLDESGNIWITDFGLAQFHADARLTQSGDVLGTLRYTSPEQAGGQRALMDHRTDVYSLGATLYELLTLQPIFNGDDRNTILRMILNDEPRPPRSINRSIPPELETIVLKAVAKTPAERYSTARELAEDLQRFLEDRPILAKPPSLMEKGVKWARRRRSVVVSALLVLLLTLAGLSAATVLITQAYERERLKAQEADEQRARADENFRQTWQAVNLLVQISQEELADDSRLKRLRCRLLDAVLNYYQELIKQRRDDPSLAFELEESRTRVKAILGELTTLLEATQYDLLHQRAIQDELQLSREQRQSIARLDERLQRAFSAFGQLRPSEREKHRLMLARDQEAEITQLLASAQLKRFKQLVRQQRGPLAFTDPDVSLALQFTAEQKKLVREIQNKLRPGGPPPGAPRVASDVPPRRPPRRKGEGTSISREKWLKKVVDELSEEQLKTWNELVGERVSDDVLSDPPRLFGPPR